MAPMRTCAKVRCESPAETTVVLRYELREVLIEALAAEHDPNLLDLCETHAECLIPPVGWVVRDRRASVPATSA